MIIFHYCDTAAFISIIKHKALWLSNTRKMNDHSEGLLVERRVVQHLQASANKKLILQTLVDDVKSRLNQSRPDLYSCCFSEETDSTAQWMNYADNGKGFAIGFDADALWKNSGPTFALDGKRLFGPNRNAADPNKQTSLGPILYCDEGSMLRIFELLDEALTSKTAADDIATGTQFFASVAKDKSFRHEQEWRLVYAPRITTLEDGKMEIAGNMENMEWRASRYGVTPYFSFHFDPSVVKEIFIGPGNVEKSDPAARHLITQFLWSQGFKHVNIHESLSPYRY